MSAMIRAMGIDFDVDAFLASSTLKTTRVFRKGEPRSRVRPDGPRNEESRFNIAASDADFAEYQRQVDESVAFLVANREEIARLVSYPGVEEVGLDFGVEWRDVPIHCDVLPAELIRIAGELGLSIEISHYPVGDDLET